MFNPRTLALIGLGLYFVAFAVIFVPYAFVSDGAETAKMMQGAGGVTLMIGGALALLGFISNIAGTVTAVLQLVRERRSSLLAILGNVIPVILVLMFLIRYQLLLI